VSDLAKISGALGKIAGGDINFRPATFDTSEIGSKAGAHNPVVSLSRGGLPVSRDYEKFIGDRGWEGVFSPEAWTKYPISTGALFLNIFHSIGWSAIKKAAEATMGILQNKERAGSTVGLAEAISADKEGKARITARLPLAGGGYERCCFSLEKISNVKAFCSLLGRGVEIERRQDGRPVLIRHLAGETTVSRGVGIDRLSVYEIASVTDALSKGYDFAGEWSRVSLRKTGNQDILPPEIAGLYVHGGTKQGILVFRGTRPLAIEDWVADVTLTHGFLSSQHDKIEATVQEARKLVGGLIVAGHSKGGGMAQYAAIKTNSRAVTFNTVGLPEALIREGAGAVASHYMTRYDWVGNMSGGKRGEGGGIAGPLAVLRGVKQRLVGGAQDIHILRSTRNRYHFLDMHSMDAVKQGLVLEPKFIQRPYETVKTGQTAGGFAHEPLATPTPNRLRGKDRGRRGGSVGLREGI
jgi:hypothetical protein